MGLTIAILLNGVIAGSTLFLVAVGLTLIFGVLGILNIAHGSFYAFGAFTAASISLLLARLGASPYLLYPAFLVAAILIGGLLGPLVERYLLRWTYTVAQFQAQREYIQLLATYAIFLVFEGAQRLIWGVQPYYTGEALTQLGQTKVAGIPYTNYQLFVVIPAAVVVFFVLRWALRRTVTGRLTVAVSEDAEISASMGIDVRKVYLISFGLGAGLAVLAGALESPTIGVAVGIGADTVILSFAVIAIAGLGQIEGTALAALAVGIAQAAAVFLYEELSSVVPYLIMLLVLLVRPYGIFGSAQRRKI